MALTVEQMTALVNTTLKSLGKLKFTEIATDLQEHVAMSRLLRKDKIEFDTGVAIQFNVLTEHSGSARNVGLANVDTINIMDGFVQGTVPWRHTTANYGIIRQLISMNSGANKIVDYIKGERIKCFISLAANAETNFWGKPANSSDDTTPFGVDYWIVKDDDEGFNGGNPDGFPSGAAGINATTNPRYMNWTAKYAAITKDDLVRKWRKGSVKTNFKSPIETPHPSYNTGNKHEYYTNYDVIGALEETLEDQNENLGHDIASMDGRLVFRRVPVTYVPFLDADALDPVYGINWGTFRTKFLAGEFFHEEAHQPTANQHTVIPTFIDLTHNYVCYDRRANFVLNK